MSFIFDELNGLTTDDGAKIGQKSHKCKTFAESFLTPLGVSNYTDSIATNSALVSLANFADEMAFFLSSKALSATALVLDFFEVFLVLAFGCGLTSSRLVTALVSFANSLRALAFLSAVAEYLAWFTALRQSLRIESFIGDEI
tara:strand:- start:5515 stop:5943 length:429 start_codon:yes stop_codon:yes gene_type:complete